MKTLTSYNCSQFKLWCKRQTQDSSLGVFNSCKRLRPAKAVMLGLGLRPQNVGLGLVVLDWGCGVGLDHILVIVKLLRTVAYVMVVK